MSSRMKIEYGLEYPRAKRYLNNLNTLLNIKPIQTPQQLISTKIFPSRKLTSSQSLTRFRYYRAQTGEGSRKSIQSQQFKSKIRNNLSKPYAKSQTILKKIPLSTYSKNNVLRFTPIQNINYKSVNYQSNKDGVLPKSHSATINNPSSENSSPTQREFLRKGSSINRQIVVNLLKIKLTKQSFTNKINDFENDQILKMIKLYKGNNDGLKDRSQSLKNNLIAVTKIQPKIQKQISAWDNDHALLQQF